jgi:ATP-binding cassette subfamily F protein 3
MHIINIDRITVNLAGHEVFRDLTWAIGDRDRVGLVGPNGAGKSTLLKALSGHIQPESGGVVRMRGVQVGYLPQDVYLPLGRTLLEEAMTLPPRLAQAESALAEIEAQLADPGVYNEPGALAWTLERHEKALAAYERLGGLQHPSRVLEILHMLGFTPDDFSLPTEALSGGQKKLVVLARLAVESPDALLLDEPDNHLDVRAKQHLERFIHSYPGAVIIVSHDRYLLDEVATHIAEMADGKLTLYVGNYSSFAVQRELARQRQQQM